MVLWPAFSAFSASRGGEVWGLPYEVVIMTCSRIYLFCFVSCAAIYFYLSGKMKGCANSTAILFH